MSYLKSLLSGLNGSAESVLDLVERIRKYDEALDSERAAERVGILKAIRLMLIAKFKSDGKEVPEGLVVGILVPSDEYAWASYAAICTGISVDPEVYNGFIFEERKKDAADG